MSASVAPSVRPVFRSRRRWGAIIAGVALTAAVIAYLLPLVLAVGMSLKTSAELVQQPLAWPTRLTFENYETVFAQMKYWRMVGNTVLITLASTVLVSLVAPLAAYPLARVPSRWTNAVYLLFVAGLTIPFFMLMIPVQLLLKALGLINTYVGVILLYTTLNLPLAVFFYTSFIRSIPIELEEASAIDGCTPVRTFWHIVLPMLQPVTGTLAMFVTLSVWNDFLLPLVFLYSPDSRTIMVSVASFIGEYGFNPATLFPAAVLASLPLLIFFFFLQRQIIAGVASGAVKG